MAKATRTPKSANRKAATPKKTARRAAGGAKASASSQRSSGSQTPTDAAAAMRAALLDLCASQGWCDLALADIVEAAGLDMAAAHAVYPTKAALLTGLARATDEAILRSLAEDPLEGSTKDRLFDLLMRRFDLMQAARDGYETLLHELPRTPLEAAAMACQMRRSLRLMLETAGISASGLKGALRLQGLMAVHLAGLRAWLRDDSADLAKTMAEIDKRLGQAARLSDLLASGLKRAAAMKSEAGKAARGTAA